MSIKNSLVIEKFLNPVVKEIPPYRPGKSKDEIAKKYGFEASDVIKLASNENPLGPSKKAVEAIKKHAKEVSAYPEHDPQELKKEIANYVHLSENNVVIGNGSDEILDLIIRMFVSKKDKVLIPIPTFSIYTSLVKLSSGIPVFFSFGKDFCYDARKILEKIDRKTKIAIICSPNNPTGSTISQEDLRKVLRNKVIVVVDEAYAEFSEGSSSVLVNEFENFIVTRTFSKAFGLAGLRIGYALASEGIAEQMSKIKIPFSINHLAQKAAIASLKDKKHLKRTVDVVKRGREFLFKEISKIPGVKVYPSQANFLLINVNSKEIVQRLLKRGVIVRDCSSFYGLDESYIRVSIGTAQENLKFLNTFKEILGI
jgi:histidinol-phosphate aminotransferase